MLEIKLVQINVLEGTNVIVGQAHFIKTVEALHDALVSSVPGIQFGLAFNESSGPRLVRREGTSEELKELATRAALEIGAGHCFVIYLRGSYPINILNAVKEVREVCQLFCATANSLQVIVVESTQGRGILGVIDGGSPLGVETEKDVMERRALLRKIGYKL